MYNQAAFVLAGGFILGCVILAFGLKQVRPTSNYVTVKGLSEREVMADKAWWSIHAQFGANTVAVIQSSIREVETEIKNFLTEKGFTQDEISIEGINIYQNNYQGAPTRLNADVRVSVTTNDIEKVRSASEAVTELIAKGLLIQSDKWASGPKYYFTKFKVLKKEMLAEATREAKAAAEEFAANSSSRVGVIRRANQGVFQILPGNRTNENEVFFPDKIIRVVSTVDYVLE